MEQKSTKLKFFEINRLIFAILNKKEKKKFLVFISLALLSLILEALGITLFLPIMSYLISPEIIENNKYFILIKSYISFERDIYYFYLLISAFTLIFVIKNFVLIAINYWQLNFGNQIRVRLSSIFFSNYLKQNLNFYLDRDKSILAKYTHYETNHIKETIFLLGNFYSEIFIIIFLISFIIFFNNPLVIILLLACFFIAVIFDYITKSKLRRAGLERFERSNKTLKIIMDAFKSIRDVKLYRKEDNFFNSFNKNNIIYGDATVKHGFILNLPRFFFESIALIFFLFLTILNLNINENVQETFVKLTVLFLITIRLLPSTNKVATAFVGLRYISHGISEMIKEYKLINDTKTLEDFSNKKIIKKFKKIIKLKSVDFGYKDNDLIFENLNLNINKGDKIALVGDSGSGKTTFLDILTGFVKPTKGQIIIDDEEYKINDISRLDLFGYVHQDVILFNDTIINNITLSNKNKYDAEELETIYDYCRKAQIYDFIISLPEGLFSYVGEDGLNISGGQKQRLGIVRALVANASILILDEATNSLDDKTEENFFEVLNDLNEELTIISINHKLKNKSFFDHIYHLDKKKLVKIEK
jgi:ATP-binding cassette, subfamily B, bacterial PglK